MASITTVTPPNARCIELFGPQVLETGSKICLVTPEELKELPIDEKLYTFWGQEVSRADADADTEIRRGHLAFGPIYPN
jgi:hypothetical protein